jgi:hypothetical protein
MSSAETNTSTKSIPQGCSYPCPMYSHGVGSSLSTSLGYDGALTVGALPHFASLDDAVTLTHEFSSYQVWVALLRLAGTSKCPACLQ